MARRALEKLIADGRIHPARIEEVVGKVAAGNGDPHPRGGRAGGLRGQRPRACTRTDQAAGPAQVPHQLRPEPAAPRHRGRPASPRPSPPRSGPTSTSPRRPRLLHDIGKAVDHEVEGPHALIGADIARRLGRSQKIVHAIAAHHSGRRAADGRGLDRPGGRRALGRPAGRAARQRRALHQAPGSAGGRGRTRSTASSGPTPSRPDREVRIMVKPERVDDLGAMRLARDIVKANRRNPGVSRSDQSDRDPRDPRSVDFAK